MFRSVARRWSRGQPFRQPSRLPAKYISPFYVGGASLKGRRLARWRYRASPTSHTGYALQTIAPSSFAAQYSLKQSEPSSQGSPSAFACRRHHLLHIQSPAHIESYRRENRGSPCPGKASQVPSKTPDSKSIPTHALPASHELMKPNWQVSPSAARCRHSVVMSILNPQ